MEDFSSKFNQFVNGHFNSPNRYLSAIIALVIMIYVSRMSTEMPQFMINMLNYTLFKFLIIFATLYVVLNYEPIVALVVSICVIAMIMYHNAYVSHSETMASIMAEKHSIPVFNYGNCGKEFKNTDPTDAIRGVDSDLNSLCMHLQTDSIPDVLTSSNFSEIVNTNQACTFAKHQYNMDMENVKCPSPSQIQPVTI